MPTVLKNILSFTGLVVGVPSVQAHGLNIYGRGVVPKTCELDGDGYTVTADDTNVTVTRNANGAAAVNVYCDYWHSIIDAESQPNGIATSIFPFVLQGGGSAGVGANGITQLSANGVTATGPQIAFVNGGNVTFGINGNTVTASVQTAGGTATGVGLSAGTQSQGTGVVILSNSNGVTFGMSNSSVITASVSSLVFSNSNNVSFGTNGSTVTATATFAAETPFGISGGTQSVSTGTVVFSNSNNVTFGMSGSSRITASASFPAETPFGVSAGTQSASTGTVAFANSNGVTFGMSGSNQITASYSQSTAPNAVAVNGAGSVTAGTVVFSNSNNISFGINGSTITASASGGGIETPFGISAGTQSISTGTVAFSNSNGVTFGMSGSNQITASFSSLVFSNSNGITFGINASTLTASFSGGAGGGIALAAGTQTATSGTVVISDSQGVLYGMSGSTRVTGRVISMIATGAETMLISGGSGVTVSQSNAAIGLVAGGTTNGSIHINGRSGVTIVGGSGANSGADVIISAVSNGSVRMFASEISGSAAGNITLSAGGPAALVGSTLQLVGNNAAELLATGGIAIGAAGAGGAIGITGRGGVTVFGGSGVSGNDVSITANGSGSVQLRAGSDIIGSAGRHIGLTANAGSIGMYAGGTGGQFNLLADSAISAKAPNATYYADNRVQVQAIASGIVLSANSSGISMSATGTAGDIAKSAGRDHNATAGSIWRVSAGNNVQLTAGSQVILTAAANVNLSAGSTAVISGAVNASMAAGSVAVVSGGTDATVYAGRHIGLVANSNISVAAGSNLSMVGNASLTIAGGGPGILSVAGDLTISGGSNTLSIVGNNRLFLTAGAHVLINAANSIQLGANVVRVQTASNVSLAFYAEPNGIVRPTLTGASSSVTGALGQLISSLAAMGLISNGLT